MKFTKRAHRTAQERSACKARRVRSAAMAGVVVSSTVAVLSVGGGAVADADGPACTSKTEFGLTRLEECFVVPPGVREVTFDVYGAAGGTGNVNGGAGGRGAHITVVVPTSPGTEYLISVGGRGANGKASNGLGSKSVDGGWNGGGSGGGSHGSATTSGGGGGGYSKVTLRHTGELLALAGGGGGGGGYGGSVNPYMSAGGDGGGVGAGETGCDDRLYYSNGGPGGPPGLGGQAGEYTDDNCGGGGGGMTGPGNPKADGPREGGQFIGGQGVCLTPSFMSGACLEWGEIGEDNLLKWGGGGGGGGGGFYGGGGGGSGFAAGRITGDGTGGGGGSSYISPMATFSNQFIGEQYGDGKVVVSWTVDTTYMPTWTACAAENGTCEFTGPQVVAYGAYNKFAFRTLSDGAACNNATFGDPAPGSAKGCFFMNTSELGQAAWDRCSSEGQHCAFTGTRVVGYGEGGTYNYKVVTNGTGCNNATFGDPLPRVIKQCISTTMPTASTFVPCASEGQLCTFAGSPTLVAFGVAGTYTYRWSTGAISCDFAGFGVDPVPGSFKLCYVVRPTT